MWNEKTNGASICGQNGEQTQFQQGSPHIELLISLSYFVGWKIETWGRICDAWKLTTKTSVVINDIYMGVARLRCYEPVCATLSQDEKWTEKENIVDGAAPLGAKD